MGLTQHPLSEAAAVLIGVGVFVVIVLDVGWRIIRHGTVMAHEGAHAVLGSLLFRNVSGIELHADATGATLMNGGITVFTPQGETEHIPFPDLMTTNVKGRSKR